MKREKFFHLLEQFAACESGIDWAKQQKGGPKKIFKAGFKSKSGYYRSIWLLETCEIDIEILTPCEHCPQSKYYNTLTKNCTVVGDKICRKYTLKNLPSWSEIVKIMKEKVKRDE